MIKRNERAISAFISYSWDSPEHKMRVRKFVEYIRKEGINAIYDDDMELGDRIARFMVNSMHNSDFVLFICTPSYKKRADENKGGVGYENTIINEDLFNTQNERKFIPVLFDGSWSDSLPNWAKGKLGVSLMQNQDSYQAEIKKLIITMRKKAVEYFFQDYAEQENENEDIIRQEVENCIRKAMLVGDAESQKIWEAIKPNGDLFSLEKIIVKLSDIIKFDDVIEDIVNISKMTAYEYSKFLRSEILISESVEIPNEVAFSLAEKIKTAISEFAKMAENDITCINANDVEEVFQNMRDITNDENNYESVENEIKFLAKIAKMTKDEYTKVLMNEHIGMPEKTALELAKRIKSEVSGFAEISKREIAEIDNDDVAIIIQKLQSVIYDVANDEAFRW